MRILQNKLLEEFRLEGLSLVVSKHECLVNVLSPVLLVEWFKRPLQFRCQCPRHPGPVWMSPKNHQESFDFPKFRAIFYPQVALRLQQTCKASLVFSHERKVIFLGGLRCEVKLEFRWSRTSRGNFFDGADEFDQVHHQKCKAR